MNNVMKLFSGVTTILRVAQGINSTLSHLYVNGLFCCYLLEDSIRQEKEPGLTCIPEGRYELQLNDTCGMHEQYKARQRNTHQGMIEIAEIPNFSRVFIHIGNYHTQTLGCPLTGAYWQMLDGDYQVMHSAAAYKYAYAKLIEKIDNGQTAIDVRNLSTLKFQ